MLANTIGEVDMMKAVAYKIKTHETKMMQFRQLVSVLAGFALSACSFTSALPASPEHPTPSAMMIKPSTAAKNTVTTTLTATNAQTATLTSKPTQEPIETPSTVAFSSPAPTEEMFSVIPQHHYQNLVDNQYLLVSKDVTTRTGSYEGTTFFLMDSANLFQELVTVYDNTRSAAFSGNGKKLALTVKELGDYHLFVFDFLKGTYGELPNAGNCIEPTWSPDGRQIAMGWCETGITVISIDTGEHYTVTRQDPLAVWHENMPAWSPDGQQIAYFQGPTFHSSPVSSCGISSDGIYVIDNPGENRVTWNNQRALLIDDCLYGPLAWSPDSQTIAIQFGEQRSLLSLQIYQPWTGLRRTLVNEKGVNRVAWSPDGQQIAFNDW
ncbi:MAG: WD40 repeat domain-containing protein, partial [Chloroflexota bacterium]